MSKQSCCEDVLKECFRHILPWNDQNVLQSVMCYDSKRLFHNVDSNAAEYDQKGVHRQLKGLRKLKKLKRVSRLFRDAATSALAEFKETFLQWIRTQECSVEGVHAGMIVFRESAQTHEVLCSKLAHVSVSGYWTKTGWFADIQAQYYNQDEENTDRIYSGCAEDISRELLSRLLLSFRMHPQSQKCLDLCTRLLHNEMVQKAEEPFCFLFENWHVLILEVEIKMAIKPNFKLMNPELWNLNLRGVDIERHHNGKNVWENTTWYQRAQKKLDKFVKELCYAWDAFHDCMGGQTPWGEPLNPSTARERVSKVNWFALSEHVIRLLELRQIARQWNQPIHNSIDGTVFF